MKRQNRRYPPEFELILSVLAGNGLRRSNLEGVEWNEFFALTRRHRIDGLIASLLLDDEQAPKGEGVLRAHMPADHVKHLEKLRQLSIAREFATFVELRKALETFTTQGVEPVVLKGLCLSQSAYHKIGCRNNFDIDLLVDPDDAEKGDRILRDLNYVRFEPEETAPQSAWRRWISRRKDAAYRHQKTGSVIELHWRLFDNPHVLPGPYPTQRTTLFGNLNCIELQPDFNFAYLCAHGSQHAFSRLKWLADIYFLAKQKSADELIAIYDRTDDGFAVAAMSQALALCRRLFGLAAPDALQARISLNKLNVRLPVFMAESTLTRGGAQEIETMRFGATLKSLSHYFLSMRPKYLAHELLFDLREKFGRRTTR